MASSGIGTPSHVFGELFRFMTGVNLVHVPLKGSVLQFARTIIVFARRAFVVAVLDAYELAKGGIISVAFVENENAPPILAMVIIGICKKFFVIWQIDVSEFAPRAEYMIRQFGRVRCPCRHEQHSDTG
jgi:hypothetical protein